MKLVSLVCALTFVMTAWTVDVVLKKNAAGAIFFTYGEEGCQVPKASFDFMVIQDKDGKVAFTNHRGEAFSDVVITNKVTADAGKTDNINDMCVITPAPTAAGKAKSIDFTVNDASRRSIRVSRQLIL